MIPNGLPIVEPRHGAFPEIINRTGGGMLVTPGAAGKGLAMKPYAEVIYDLKGEYREFEAVLEAVNESDYGLQTGIFTQHIGRIFQAFERLEVGAVLASTLDYEETVRFVPAGGGGCERRGCPSRRRTRPR